MWSTISVALVDPHEPTKYEREKNFDRKKVFLNPKLDNSQVNF